MPPKCNPGSKPKHSASPYPIGSVRTYKIDATVSDMGILTVHRDARALGLGRKLVAHAERVAIEDGARTARLEDVGSENVGIR